MFGRRDMGIGDVRRTRERESRQIVSVE